MAAGTLSSGTMSGIEAVIAGLKKELTTDEKIVTRKSAKMTDRVVPVPLMSRRARVSTASPFKVSQKMIIFRREYLSANVPPSGPSTTDGSMATIINRPMSEADPVARLTQNMTAMWKAWEPIWLTSCPCHSRKKFRFINLAGGVMPDPFPRWDLAEPERVIPDPPGCC